MGFVHGSFATIAHCPVISRRKLEDGVDCDDVGLIAFANLERRMEKPQLITHPFA